MFRNRLYYGIKPLLPAAARMAVRRWFAVRKREQVKDSWPILPGSEKKPENWPGWPDGKKFAFVLTHDVEGPAGLAKCLQLMKLEMELGFRSSFNFIPNGPYSVPKELRDELIANGFEVGVHDLHHDGKLYASRQVFARKAKRINQYLKEWGAVGFRSGFMLRKLDWLHDLDVAYDGSSFDTDPFEPQPDGVGTIFPFWVPRPMGTTGASPVPSGDVRPLTSDVRPLTSDVQSLGTRPSPLVTSRGYVELPYTLPQDSTLFLLFRERHPDIWIQKLDWIARHGGMALLNVHPDYIRMDGERISRSTYPISFYRDFLQYMREKYSDSFWHPLPRSMADFVSTERVAPANSVKAAGVSLPGKAVTQSSTPLNNTPLKVNRSKAPVWIDLDNTPHVVFFEPIIDELRARGFPVVITARDAFQVCELAKKKKISFVQVGRHYGKNRFLKVSGVLYRALQLAPLALREKPALSVSHGARSQIVISNLLRIPTLLLADYEFAKYPPLMRPTWEMVPSVIPDSALCCDNNNILKYPGIKEDVYVWKFQPDPQFLAGLGLNPCSLIITMRPPATEAHYHNPESEGLFEAFMEKACRHPNSRIVLLPRNKQQGETIRHRWPHWFANDKTIIPKGALDGLDLIWNSDLIVSGGGTMNREAAALGVPVYSIFRGPMGAVDRHLQNSGRLVMVESLADVDEKIKLEKRAQTSLSEATSRKSFQHIVNTIEELALKSKSNH